ncbi:hypothetical protein [Nonomuraea bangladeshensis]|uniref:hypothetical protein n=1 Tax=Nonomuraea bangladeshensis TaxID=404385 RepID=UPI003C2C152B
MTLPQANAERPGGPVGRVRASGAPPARACARPDQVSACLLNSLTAGPAAGGGQGPHPGAGAERRWVGGAA